MAYVALYRKYRSQSFGEVIGQAHVTTVLQNAIRLGRIAHAYLFCGPRGCGKTSTARLLARALNCQAAPGPTPEPCGTCEMCRRIREGTAMDVIEMDAASETGIDDVREKIIENAKYAPGEARYKVYIIDEVHDLSIKAFDSLLKTIEEPPAHVVFVLATTEIHKVPITIRSRCQRMDFKRGTLGDLTDNIRRVLDRESIGYDPEAVAAVARAAEGSFRDSLSLLEQVLAYTDGTLTTEAVHASIGTVGPQVLDDLARTLASDDLAAAYFKAGELVDSGKDVKQTLVALQAHLRDLLIAGFAQGPQALADVSDERFAQLKEQAAMFDPNQLLAMLDVLAEAERDIRFTNQHRLLLERALWSILPSSLAARTQVSAPAAAPARAAAPRPAAPPARGMETHAPAHAPAAPVQPAPQTPTYAPAPAPVPAPAPAVPPPAHAVESAPPAAAHPQPAAAPMPTAPPPPDDEEEEEEAIDPSVFAPSLTLDVVRRVWPRVKKEIHRKSPTSIATFTDDVELLTLRGLVIELGFPSEFARGKADRPKGRAFVEQTFCRELGVQGIKVQCVLLDAPQEAAPVVQAPTGLDLSMESSAPQTTTYTLPNGSTTTISAAPAAPAEPAAVAAVPPPVTSAVSAPQPVSQAPTAAPPQATVPVPTPSAPVDNEDELFLNLVMEEFHGTLMPDEET